MLVIIISISTIAMLIGMTIILFNEISLFKEEIKNNALLNAKLTSEYCAAPLLFEYKDEAENILAKLNAIPNITNACLYKDNGEILAEFSRSDDTKIEYPKPEENGYSFEDDCLNVFQDVSYQGNKYGSIYLRVSTTELQNKIYSQLGLYIIIIIASIILVYFLANNFQKIITNPILNLASVAHKISSTNDYSSRVNIKGNDEISDLYTSFNKMLDQIEVRDEKINETLNALIESEQRYKLAVNAGKVGVWEWIVGEEKNVL